MSGSLRTGSYSNAMLATLREKFAGRADLQLYDLAPIPLYNQDFEGDKRPPVVKKLLADIEEADGLVLCAPEFNHSIPGVLKNAIDWASRPAFQSVLAYKPVAIMATSRGPLGGARCLEHMKVALDSCLSRVALAREVIITAAEARSATAASSTKPRSASPAARSRRCSTRSASGIRPRRRGRDGQGTRMTRRPLRDRRTRRRLGDAEPPAVNNAYNGALIDAVIETFGRLGRDPPCAPSCCAAPAALPGRRRSRLSRPPAHGLRRGEPRILAPHRRRVPRRAALSAADLALVHGGCFGGGVGIAAACDIAIAAEDAVFALTEVRWGITPAPIMPLLVDRIGARHDRPRSR